MLRNKQKLLKGMLVYYEDKLHIVTVEEEQGLVELARAKKDGRPYPKARRFSTSPTYCKPY